MTDRPSNSGTTSSTSSTGSTGSTDESRASTGDPPHEHLFPPPTKPVGPVFVASLLAAQLFFFIALLGPAIVATQVKVMSMFPGDSAAQVSAMKIIPSVGAFGAVVANVVFGQISDRTTSRWGRRRPWLVIGIVAMAAGLVIMGIAGTVPMVTLGWLVAQVGANAALAPYVAVLSDQVPEFQRARISSWIAIAQNMASLAATYLATYLDDRILLLFIGPAVPAVIFMVIFAFVLPDRALPVKPPPFRLVDTIKMFWVNPLTHPDYALAWWGRFLITLASFCFTTYRLMFLVHRINLEQGEATTVMATSVLIYTLTLLAASFAGGWLSDLLRRRKIFVVLASTLFGLGTAMLAHTHTVEMFYAVEAVMGLAYGTYIAVDLALVVDVLPDPDKAGKDLGVFNIANALPQSLAPALAGVLLAIGSADSTNYPLLCYFAGACAILGGVITIYIRKVR